MAKKQEQRHEQRQNVSQKVSAVIPTIGRIETLPVVITALGFQTHPIDELILLDEAKTPVTEAYAVNQALELPSK